MRITLRMSQIDRVRLNQHLRNKKKNQTYKSNYKTLSNFTFKIHRKTTNWATRGSDNKVWKIFFPKERSFNRQPQKKKLLLTFPAI